jgi:hypothetical protein
MEFIKNEIINEVLRQYFVTFEMTLDTAEYVPAKYGKKIHKFIFKNMKQKFNQVNREYRKEKAARKNQVAPTETPKDEIETKPAVVVIKEKRSYASPPAVGFRGLYYVLAPHGTRDKKIKGGKQ